VEGDAVPARVGDLGEVALRLDDHEMAVERPSTGVDQRGDRLQDDRPDRDRLHELSVADVEVEHARTGAEQLLDLLAEPGEVGRVERRLDLGRAVSLATHVRAAARGDVLARWYASISRS
jgi:hypothetical protein